MADDAQRPSDLVPVSPTGYINTETVAGQQEQSNRPTDLVAVDPDYVAKQVSPYNQLTGVAAGVGVIRPVIEKIAGSDATNRRSMETYLRSQRHHNLPGLDLAALEKEFQKLYSPDSRIATYSEVQDALKAVKGQVPGIPKVDLSAYKTVAKPTTFLGKADQLLKKTGEVIEDVSVPGGGFAKQSFRAAGRGGLGFGAGYEAADAYNKLLEGDVAGAIPSASSAAGYGALLATNPKIKAAGAVLAGAPLVGKYFVGDAQAAPMTSNEASSTGFDLASSLLGPASLALSPSELGAGTLNPKRDVYRPGMRVLQGSTMPPQQRAHGGLVHLAQGGKSNTSPFIGYPQITSKPRDPNFKQQSGPILGAIDALIGAGPRSDISILNPQDLKYSESYDKFEPYGIAAMAAPFLGGPMKAVGKAAARELGPKAADMAEDYLSKIGGIQYAVPKAKMSPKMSFGDVFSGEQTVTDPLRNAFPGIYKRPDVIAQEAAARVAPESPALKQLFGVTRDDLYQMGKGRVGNMSGVLPGAAANPKGSRAALNVMNPRNEQRLLDVLSESEKYPSLVRGMDPWYIMDPAYKRLEELVGPEEAVKRYKQLNTLTGMASPGSDVLTEMNRGTAANYLATQGRFNDFVNYAGKPMGARGADFPDDLRAVMGHPYHRTAQAIPMQQYLDTGAVQMSSPKVPAYIQASSVPQAGFQTDLPVGDAHWSRAVGLADTRGAATRKGQSVVPGASVSNPEMSTLAPWWKDKIAGQVGLESVPAQARAWGAFSPQTGVESPIGAPKLELLSMKIMEAANRYKVSPEQARDMILKGEGYAGKKEGGQVQNFQAGRIVRATKDLILPAAENSARTQIIGTLPTYGKAADILAKQGAGGTGIDVGAGLGKGAEVLSNRLNLPVNTMEPYAQKWSPNYSSADQMPSDAHGFLTNLNVLNVMPREARDELVQHIGRTMEPGGLGVLTTRGADVMKAQGRPGPEPMSMITSRDTYQKGFTKQELEDYIRYMLGKGYDIDKLNLGPAGVMIKKK